MQKYFISWEEKHIIRIEAENIKEAKKVLERAKNGQLELVVEEVEYKGDTVQEM